MSSGPISQEFRIESSGDARGASTPQPQVRGLVRAGYVALGGVFLALAGVGVVVPGLPATPFLLLASFFLVRSTPRFHQRLLRSRVFGPLLQDWQKHRGVRPRVKRTAVVVVLATVGSSLTFGQLSTTVLGLLVVGSGVGLTVVLRLPVIPADRRPAERGSHPATHPCPAVSWHQVPLPSNEVAGP